MKKFKDLTIDDFTGVIPHETIKDLLTEAEYNRFMNWMNGQTMVLYGVYRCDLENYLRQRQKGRKNPIVYD